MTETVVQYLVTQRYIDKECVNVDTSEVDDPSIDATDLADMLVASEHGGFLDSGGEPYHLYFTPDTISPQKHGFESFCHCYVEIVGGVRCFDNIGNVIDYMLAKKLAEKHGIGFQNMDDLINENLDEFRDLTKEGFPEDDEIYGVFVADATPESVGKIIAAVRAYDKVRYSCHQDSEAFQQLSERVTRFIQDELDGFI